MKPFVFWPDRETLRLITPLLFRKHFGTRFAAIIDCFEVLLKSLEILEQEQTHALVTNITILLSIYLVYHSKELYVFFRGPVTNIFAQKTVASWTKFYQVISFLVGGRVVRWPWVNFQCRDVLQFG